MKLTEMKRDFVPTVICCIDGRIQEPIHKYFKDSFNADYVNIITEPGINRVLARDESSISERIYQKVINSIDFHNSKLIVIVGHYNCGANPSSEAVHIMQIKKSLEIMQEWDLPGDPVLMGLWINDSLEFEVIKLY